MSSEPRTASETELSHECAYCSQTVSEERLAFQSYPESDEAAITGLTANGLTLCPDCSSEPVALIESWDGHDQPPIEPDRSIGAGYREVADSCSFCADGIESEPVLGIELYRRPGENLPAYANYTLCSSCGDVFEEFLANIRSTES